VVGQLVDRLHERKRPRRRCCVAIQITERPLSKTNEIPDDHPYKLVKVDINPIGTRGFPWHSGQITTETAQSETGRHAPGLPKN
jgi:hypothetical protein